MTEVWTSIGDFFIWTFKILPVLGNVPNILLMGIGFIAFFYWMGQMRKHAQAGEK